MLNHVRPIFISLSLLLAAGSAAAAPSLSAADRIELERLKTDNDEAWNRRDSAFIVTQYVDNASIRVATDAPLVSGRPAIATFFSTAFARRDGEYRHVTSLDHLEPLDGTSVLSEGNVRVEKRDGDQWRLVRRFRTLSIAVRRGATWKLRSVRAIPLGAN